MADSETPAPDAAAAEAAEMREFAEYRAFKAAKAAAGTVAAATPSPTPTATPQPQGLAQTGVPELADRPEWCDADIWAGFVTRCGGKPVNKQTIVAELMILRDATKNRRGGQGAYGLSFRPGPNPRGMW